MSTALDPKLTDQSPELEAMEREVLDGLRGDPKSIHCKYLYDRRGSELFDRICELDDYYPTRTEVAIMERHVADMAEVLGPRVLLVELGSGSSLKTRVLLDHLEDPAGYVPVDISLEHLETSARALAADYPELEVVPVCADYTADYELPVTRTPARRRVVYYPGSTIGNFAREEAQDFLDHIADIAGPGGGLLIGVDLRKPADVLERAYDDSEGVTAEFNLNLLRRLNRELDADFDLDGFRHTVRWDAAAGRIDLYLESRREQTVHLGGETVDFAAGERVHTEHSHKFTLDGFRAMAADAGLEVRRVWTDERRWFSVQYAVVVDA